MKFAFALALLSSAPLASNAAMVQFQYQSTITNSVPAADIEAGDDLFITITLDNGGPLESGEWIFSDVESIRYQVGAGVGTYSFTFYPKEPDFVWPTTAGSFVTNAEGGLTQVPWNWSGNNLGNRFYIDRMNEIFIAAPGAGAISLRDIDPSRNITVAGWTPSAVPEPSAALLGGLGALALLRRRRR